MHVCMYVCTLLLLPIIMFLLLFHVVFLIPFVLFLDGKKERFGILLTTQSGCVVDDN